MPSTFANQFATYGAPPELAHFSEAAVYKPFSGSPAASISIRGIVGDEQIQEVPRPDGRWEERRRTFEFSTNPSLATYGGIADPRTTDIVVLTDSGNEEWAVQSIAGNQDSMTAVMLFRERKLETTPGGAPFHNPFIR